MRATWLLIGLGVAVPAAALLAFAGPIIAARVTGGGYHAIASGSMRPTLEPGDRVLSSAWPGGVPPRGAVVVHRNYDGVDHVHRVIALPGETVRMVGGRVEIDGVVVPAELVGEDIAPSPSYLPCTVRRGADCVSEVWRETLPGAAPHLVLDMVKDGFSDETAAVTVPEGHVFLMGDHRDNSLDSRNEIGPAPVTEVRAIMTRVHFSLGDDGFRGDRLFLRVE